MIYAKAISACIDPIEKKPLSHFNPGALVMSIATVGCNFRLTSKTKGGVEVFMSISILSKPSKKPAQMSALVNEWRFYEDVFLPL